MVQRPRQEGRAEDRQCRRKAKNDLPGDLRRQQAVEAGADDIRGDIDGAVSPVGHEHARHGRGDAPPDSSQYRTRWLG